MASGSSAPLFPLLDLPSATLLRVFECLPDLHDAVALSLACRELWGLGAAARRRHVCCAACGHTVLQPAVAFASDTHRDAAQLRLPDGPSWAVDEQHVHPGCTLGEELELKAFETIFSLRIELRLRRAGDEGYELRAQEVRCGGCGLHLGLRLVQLGKLRADAAASCIRYWRELQVLGACFLARAYLRLRAPDGREEHLGRPPPPEELALYRCTGARSPLRRAGEGCGAPLFQRRAVLSRQHCWDAGGGPERAYFVNALLPGAVAVRNERPEELAQGPMKVADVYCSACAARIGWRFCEDLAPGALANCNQVGRFGVVRSSMFRPAADAGSGGTRGEAAQAAPTSSESTPAGSTSEEEEGEGEDAVQEEEAMVVEAVPA